MFMAISIAAGAVHHLALTVTDVDRARAFYTSMLGFQVAMETPRGVLLSNGSLVLALFRAPNPDRALRGDRFDENRVGLDHLSLVVGSRAELEQVVRLFNDQGISHGEIEDLGPLGIDVLAFRDPDNIQLELTAPHS